jgi:uncharacterized protein DUF2441
MPLYHVSKAQLSVGQVLQPGEWGRTTRQFRKGGRALTEIGDAVILAWESSLETARRVLVPNAPSRFDCVFTCQAMQGAVAFRRRFRPQANIYEVETVSTTSPTFTGDYDLITDTGHAPFVDTWVEKAILYWTSKPQGIAEVLIKGEVRVLGRVP